MSLEAYRWLMTAVNAPLERAAFRAEPGPGKSSSTSLVAASVTPTSVISTTASGPTIPCRWR